jgi:hypothetical protein
MKDSFTVIYTKEKNERIPPVVRKRKEARGRGENGNDN